jgi:GT2 family glycosyltransferase
MTQLTPQAEVPEKQTPRISVIIVSLNRIESLRASLKALGAEHQVIVVDNGSMDGSENIVQEFPRILFHQLPRNFGLTKALNIGLRAAEGEYLLWLHDDAAIAADAVTRLADYLESHPDAGAVCPLLTDAAGNPVPQVRALPTPSEPDPALRLPLDGKESHAEELTVDATSCAAIMFRSFFLRALRHVDERYGTYGPAIEIPMQVRRANKKVVILHSVTAIHETSPSPVPAADLAGDRAAGTAVYLGKHHGFTNGIVYRLKTAIISLFTMRFSVLLGVISGQKIDGTR